MLSASSDTTNNATQTGGVHNHEARVTAAAAEAQPVAAAATASTSTTPAAAQAEAVANEAPAAAAVPPAVTQGPPPAVATTMAQAAPVAQAPPVEAPPPAAAQAPTVALSAPNNNKKRKSSAVMSKKKQGSLVTQLQSAVSSHNTLSVLDQYQAIQHFLKGLSDEELMVWNVAAEKERQNRTKVRTAHYATTFAARKTRSRRNKGRDVIFQQASSVEESKNTNTNAQQQQLAAVAATTAQQPGTKATPQVPPPAVAPPQLDSKMQRFEINWNCRFQELLDYRVEHGHVDVPDEAIPRLSKWVQGQRQLYKHRMQRGETNALSDERIQKLKNVGFRFSIKDDFETRLEQLCDFRQQFGHVRVPQHYTGHNKLGTYVKGLRASYKQWQNPTHETKTNHCKLTEERIQKLNEIGFEWVVKKRG